MLIIFSASSVWAENDAEVILRESMLNGFLDAVGPISRTEKFNVKGISGEYTWTVKNPRMEISTDKVRFKADATINVMKAKYDTSAYGDVEVKYDPVTNKISVKVLRVMVQIYFKVMGKRIDITEIDISQFYKMQFEFAGPKTDAVNR